MRTPVFTGNCPALVTPFDANGNINYDAFGKLIDDQIAAGVDAVCVCGTTGESATMSIREHNAAVEYCVKRVNKRVKVIAGAGSNENMPTTELSEEELVDGAIDIMSLLVKTGLCASKSEARCNIQQGGVSANDDKISDISKVFTAEELKSGVILKRGKKNFNKVILK
jgi:hypothetical protein